MIDQAKINGAALALCAMTCPEAKRGGTCEHLCEAARDPSIWNCSHLKLMRRWAAAALIAEAANAPN